MNNHELSCPNHTIHVMFLVFNVSASYNILIIIKNGVLNYTLITTKTSADVTISV